MLLVTGMPLLTAQAEIWLDEQLSEEALAYTMADCLDIRGDLDVGRLVEAIRGKLRESECTRARFVVETDLPRQVIEPFGEIPFAVVDVSGESDPEAAARRLMIEEIERPFDMSGAVPLHLYRLYPIGPKRHLLLWKVHHLIFDGFSRTVMYPRMAELYRDPTAGRPIPPLRTLIDAEEAYNTSDRRAQDREYWISRLKHLPPAGTWSTADPVRGCGYLRRTKVLSTEATSDLRRLAGEAGVSLPTLLITAASMYTHRVTGLTDFTLTLPVTSRAVAAQRAVPGMTANFLPLCQSVRREDTLGELLERTWNGVVGTLRHQRYRGSWLRRDLAFPMNSRSFGPLVNVLPQQPLIDFGDCVATAYNLSTGMVDDVSVTFLEVPGGKLEVYLNVNPALYSDDDVTSHLARLTGFLERLPELGLDGTMGGIDLLDPDDRRRQLVDWNNTGTDHAPQGVVESVEERAGQPASRDRVAVRDDEGDTTYQQLAERARRASARLRARGVGQDDVVGVLARPGAPLVTAILAILGAGASWTPCEVDGPVSRSAGNVTDAGARLLVAGPGCEAQARALAEACPGPVDVLDVDDLDAGALADDGAPERVPFVDAESLAYVLFTSGSTGRPKGAMVHRGGMLNHLQAKIDDLGLGASDCVVHNAPVTFDVSVWQMLAPLLAGSRVRAVSRQTAADPDALFSTVAVDGVTVLEVVPSLLRAALDVWDATGEVPSLSGLRWLVVTGEALPPDLCGRWFAIAPDVPLVNAYGPTECSDDVTHEVITATSWAAERELRLGPGGRVPIGRPVRNTALYVLDDYLAPVPVGVQGELYVAGAGVGRGYVKDPRRTSTAFIADPFSSDPGARLYRTGDRVVYEPDGRLTFVERVDHQVKIRGHRVELGEVEAALRTAPGVRDAAAVVRTDGTSEGRPGQARLVAYLVPKDGDTLADPDAVIDHVHRRLPEYMWPSRTVVLSELPLTPNGKVDRKRLLPGDDLGTQRTIGTTPSRPAAVPAPASAKTPATAAGTEATPDARVLEIVRRAVAQAVGLASVGPDDDFFALGGDSISALRVVTGVRREGLVLTPRDVYRHRTVRALAEHIRTLGGVAVPRTDSGADRSGTGDFALTPIMHQLRLAGGPVENYAQYVVLDGPPELDLAGLRTAVDRLRTHHDALRTRLTVSATGTWSLAVPTEAPGPVSDLVSSRTAGDDVVETCVTDAVSRLDPHRGVMLQAVLIGAGTGAPLVLLMIHHLVVDGVSWRVLIDDLAAIWQARSQHEPVVLDPVGTSFRAWTHRLTADAGSARRHGEVELWRENLHGPARLGGTKPLDPGRDVYGTAGTLRVEMSPELTSALLTDAAWVFRAEINDVLLTALLLAFLDADPEHGVRDTTDLLVELEGHGREYLGESVDLDRTVGWFTSVFPLRLDLGSLSPEEVWASGPALANAVARVRELRNRLPDHGLGHGLLRYLDPQTVPLLAGYERPQIGFNYLGRFDARQTGEWCTHPGTPVVGTAAADDLPLQHVLEITPVTQECPDGPRLVTDWLWASEILPAERVSALAESWSRALALLATAARGTDVAPLTPSDVLLVRVTQQQLDELAETGPLADVLPVGPLQRGLMFLTELNDASHDPYELQLVVEVHGDLDAGRLRSAAEGLLRGHPQLGAGFRYLEDSGPVQVIPLERTMLWTEHDVTGELGGELPEGPGEGGPSVSASDDLPEPARRVVEQEREHRFVLSDPPLLRLALVRMAPDRHLLVLTAHHIVIDGWSMPILMRDLIELYHAGSMRQVAPYRGYLEWLVRQDRQAAVAAWREELEGVGGPTLAGLEVPDPARRLTLSHRRSWYLEGPDLAELTAFSRSQGLTLGVVVQGCWALLLAEMTGRDDVTFGSVVAGRPPELPGVESMVGMFLNTVPVRVAPEPKATLVDVLCAVRDQQLRVQPHSFLPLGEIFGITGVGELFDSVVVVENFPMETVAELWGEAGLSLASVRLYDSRHYPISLVADPRDSEHLHLHLDYLPEIFDEDEVVRLGDRFVDLVHTLVRTPHATVAGTVRGALLRTAPDTGVVVPPVRDADAPADAGDPGSDPGVETRLAEALAEALGLAQVEPTDDFFALGGDSISAIRVVACARRRGLTVALRDVFALRTPRALARQSTLVVPAPSGGGTSAPVTTDRRELGDLDGPDGLDIELDPDEFDDLVPLSGSLNGSVAGSGWGENQR
ncbi:MAG: hypothetical protein QG622_1679 [Actinomycetota bacterium]|nr:hypothetical protein [Actinomycetota bacterium]